MRVFQHEFRIEPRAPSQSYGHRLSRHILFMFETSRLISRFTSTIIDDEKVFVKFSS